MILATYLLSALATALAWTLARRSVEHRPVAYLLSAGLAVDLVRRALRISYILPVVRSMRGQPLSGLPLVASHVNDALFLIWPAALAACALFVFMKRKPWPVLAAYTATIAGLVFFHPYESTGMLGRVFTSFQLVCVVASLGFAATWYLSPSTERTSTAQASVTVIVAGELATFVGAWRVGVFDNWHISQILYLLLYAVLSVMQGGFLWQSRSR